MRSFVRWQRALDEAGCLGGPVPIDRSRVEALGGRTVDLVFEDGHACVVALGLVQGDGADGTVAVHVLAVEANGSRPRRARLRPDHHALVPLAVLRYLRLVVFVTGSGQ